MDKIGRNELCPCGSNKKFKKCHINSKDKELHTGKRQSALIRSMWAESGGEDCIFKDNNNCNNPIIGAHSIQNNGVISKLAEDGHVLMPVSDFFHNGMPITSFKKVSRNKATTFTGFCSYHDNKVFKEIDTNSYQNSRKQNFLFAYRSFTKEYYEKYRQLTFFRKIFSDYPNRCMENNFISSAIMPSLTSHNDNLFDLKLFNKSFQVINYDVLNTVNFKLNYEVNFATSAMFEMDYDFENNMIYDSHDFSDSNKPPKLFLNIFPEKGITWIILSCFKTEYQKYRNVFDTLQDTYINNREKFYNLMTNMVMTQTDNIVIGNRLINYWGKEKTHEFISDWEFTAILTNLPELNKFLKASNLTQSSPYDLFKRIS